MSSKNTLSEFRLQHGLAKTQFNKKRGRPDDAPILPVPVPPQASRKARSGWHLYLAEHRSKGIGMRGAAASWHALSEEEKATYTSKGADLREKVDNAPRAITADEDAFRTSFCLSTPHGHSQGCRLPVPI